MISGIFKKIILVLLALGAAGGLGYLGYQNYTLTQEKFVLGEELAKTRQEFASTSQGLMVNIEALNQLLITTQSDRVNAEQDARKKQELVDAMTAQVESMSGTLNLYKKIVNTDSELLAKYSKVYFLNENYTPRHSIVIPPSYTYMPESLRQSRVPDDTKSGDSSADSEKMISVDVWPFLQKMLDDAGATTIDLKIASAFRSFDTQSKLKSSYKVTYGSGSNTFSADQGYSEHQLGTTIDFTTTKLGANNSTFEKTASYVWLTENAYKYGFILSYPKKNAYYIFEPWHWRFVGKSLALRLHNENKNFYDLTQREIDEYLGVIFDQQ